MATRWLGKRKRDVEKTEDEEVTPLDLSALFGQPLAKHIARGGASLYSIANHVYFQDDITFDSASTLMQELRRVENVVLQEGITSKGDPQPIYLHITTHGGSIHAAFSVIDCMNELRVPVYTVADGYVASAGTLISVCGAKRFIKKNAYMLIHELRSMTWGKFTELEDQHDNIKKIMKHIINLYAEKTNLNKKELAQILKKDVDWDANDCLKNGLVDELM